VSFLQEREQQINDLLADPGKGDPLEPGAYEGDWSNEMRGLLREYPTRLREAGWIAET
jgi:hypothetical protein